MNVKSSWYSGKSSRDESDKFTSCHFDEMAQFDVLTSMIGSILTYLQLDDYLKMHFLLEQACSVNRNLHNGNMLEFRKSAIVLNRRVLIPSKRNGSQSMTKMSILEGVGTYFS